MKRKVSSLLVFALVGALALGLTGCASIGTQAEHLAKKHN